MNKALTLLLAVIPVSLSTGSNTSCFKPVKKIDPTQEKCLATMVYGEARGESFKGKVAVAHTALNRAIKKTVCQVVLAPKQYSIFNNNPKLKAVALDAKAEPTLRNLMDKSTWEDSKKAAAAALAGISTDPTNGSTHYISDTVMKLKGYKYPKWSKQFEVTIIIEKHRFFKSVDPRAASL